MEITFAFMNSGKQCNEIQTYTKLELEFKPKTGNFKPESGSIRA